VIGSPDRRPGRDAEPEELLAQAIHELYLEQRLADGQLPGSTPSMVAWEELPEEFRESSRGQARDTTRLLAVAGYVFEPAKAGAREPRLTEAEIETLARLVHERWYEERQRSGWKWGAARDDESRIHPDLVSWDELSEERREIDRHIVRGLPHALAVCGQRLVRVTSTPEC
jgi:hypothetical protein